MRQDTLVHVPGLRNPFAQGEVPDFAILIEIRVREFNGSSSTEQRIDRKNQAYLIKYTPEPTKRLNRALKDATSPAS